MFRLVKISDILEIESERGELHAEPKSKQIVNFFQAFSQMKAMNERNCCLPIILVQVQA